MLGNEHMVRLRSIAKLHNLAAGSQTIPNSATEAAVAQGRSPQVGPSPPIALPAPERKKLPPKRAKRKTPRVVSDEEEDESTEGRLICKRKRATVAEPPAAEGTSPNYTENPPTPPHPLSLLGMLSLQMPQLLELHKNRLLTHNLPPNLQRRSHPSHHRTRSSPHYPIL